MTRDDTTGRRQRPWSDTAPDVRRRLEEEVDEHESNDRPLEAIAVMERVVELEPDDLPAVDRLARLYDAAGAWMKAAEAFEQVARLARDDRARAALRAAARLYRANGRRDRAAAMYRAIVTRRPSDVDAWRALDELLEELEWWPDLAEVRAALAERAGDAIERAALLRAQARALDSAGDAPGAARVLAEAARLAPEDQTAVVERADLMIRGGRRLEARSLLEESLARTPSHVPALQRLASLAADDPDPRTYAEARLRHAEALADPMDKAAVLLDAARWLRDRVRDRASAARVFEEAAGLLAGDEDAQAELDEARAALLVERAAAEARAGDTATAERRLRAALASRPHDVDANLGLAQLYTDLGRLEDAAELLRTALAAAAQLEEERVATLIHRYAVVVAGMGDEEEAHNLLQDAHRLNRHDLVITLALGESCFRRKLWREAALHLGNLAEHPDVAANAAAVAVGLVHAAQADVRALRPGNAVKRYEAAVRLDPACGPAWHALAEEATARGDMAAAADCLEKEAAVTVDVQARVRLYDALGDLALGVLDDAARAERCWLAAGDDVAVLDKLLALQRKRGATALERAATCEKLAALHPDAAVRCERLGEALDAFVAAGDPDRARAAAGRLAEEWPLDEDAVWRATDPTLAAGDAAAWSELSSAWLERALTAWDAQVGGTHPRRAELWRRLGDARRARGEHRSAQGAYERAVKIAPESDGAQAARRGLVTLATASGRQAIETLAALVEADQDPGDVLAYGRELATLADAGQADPDAARAMLELALALGAAIGEPGEEFLARNPARAMASAEAYAGALDDADRRALIDDQDDPPLAEILETCWEAAALVCPDTKTALARAGVTAERVSPVSASAAAALYPQVSKALGGPMTLLYGATAVVPSRSGGGAGVSVILASPPVVLLGLKLVSRRAQSRSDAGDLGDAELRFTLGRAVELARPRRAFAAGESFALLVSALWHAFGPGPVGEVDAVVATEAERLRGALTVRLRSRLTEQLAPLSRDALDPERYMAACARAADRAGLLACGHAGVALAAAGGAAAARHLVRLAGSQRYLAARRKLIA